MSWSSFRQSLTGRAPDAKAASVPIPGATAPSTPSSPNASNGRNTSDAASRAAQPAPKFEAFDPTALERGVKAIRELNDSPHAGRALELSSEQEKSRQLKLEAQIEQQRAESAAFSKKAQMDLEEKRNQMGLQRSEEERRTALYKAKVQAKFEQQKLEDRKAYDQEQLRKQHEEFLRQEAVRKQNEEEIQQKRLAALQQQAKIDRQTARVRAEAEADGRIKQDKATEDITLRRMHEEKLEERRSRLDSIGLHYENLRGIGSAVMNAASDPMQMAKGVGLVTALSIGFFGARSGTTVIGRYVQARLGRPQLVRESSRSNWLSPSSLISDVRKLVGRQLSGHESDAIDKVILPRFIKSRLLWIADSTVATKKQGTPYRHMLMHGAPGTGKTLFARALAQNSGMDYAIVSGGDLSQLGDAAVTELHQLFDWAEHSPRGAILFFDEADSFLRSGREGNMSEQGRHVVSAFLQRTGTETNKFMIVLASNLPVASFDSAVRDRVDEFIEFPLPQKQEREKMLKLFFERYLETSRTDIISRLRGLSSTLKMHEFGDAEYSELADRTVGMSGRQLAKFVIALRAAIYGGLAPKVTPSVAEQLLDWKEWEETQQSLAGKPTPETESPNTAAV